MLLLTLTLLAAAPTPAASAKPVKALPMLSAPLGRLGTFVDAPPAGGLPADEKVIVGKLEGCDREQALYLTRAVSGTLVAVEQLQAWLGQTKGLEKKLFAAGKLGEVAQGVASSAAMDQKLCEPPALVDGFKLEPTRNTGKLCDTEKGWRTGDFWWAKAGKPTAVASVVPAPAEAKDRCRPRLSVVLFDKAGIARVRLHADYGGVASLSLLGDKCVGLDFGFDAGVQSFVPTWRTTKSCKP
jgi:hypothetical protein